MRINARTAVGSVITAFVVLLSAMVLALTATVQSAVNLMAGTALIVPGTGTPDPSDSTNYMSNALNNYVIPGVGGTCGTVQSPTCGTAPVPYIAQFWPFPFEGWGGLNGAKWNDSVQSGVNQLTADLITEYDPMNENVLIFGYSQGATVASRVKESLRELNPQAKDNLAFVLIGNPNRANGGLFERLAILGTVPILDATFGQPTPTDIGIATTDIAFQYDGVADFPAYPINVLADLNALAGFWYVHGTYLDPRGRPTTPEGSLPYGYSDEGVRDIIAGCVADPSGANCQQTGDTTYVTIPATSLPIMQPFIDLGNATNTSALINPVVALLQPAMQTLIETGYDRSDYGNPTPFQIIPLVNPIKLASDLIQDIPEGINAAVETIQTGQIPDLPPSWGSDESTSTTLLAKTTATQDATKLALPKLKLDLPKLDLKAPKGLKLLKSVQADSDIKGSDDTAVAVTDATKSDKPKIRPLRDLTKAVQKALDKAEKRISGKETAKAAA